MPERTLVVISCFFKLKKHFPNQSSSFQYLENIIHVFVSSHPEYCNSLSTTLNHSSVSRLHFVQNAATRHLSSTQCRAYITPVLVNLHRSPRQCRNDFKILLIIYKPPHGLAPLYISELLCPLADL